MNYVIKFNDLIFQSENVKRNGKFNWKAKIFYKLIYGQNSSMKNIFALITQNVFGILFELKCFSSNICFSWKALSGHMAFRNSTLFSFCLENKGGRHSLSRVLSTPEFFLHSPGAYHGDLGLSKRVNFHFPNSIRDRKQRRCCHFASFLINEQETKCISSCHFTSHQRHCRDQINSFAFWIFHWWNV